MAEISFTKLTIEAKAKIERFTLSSDCRNCDLNFMNLASWQFLYATEYAIWEKWLVFRFYADGHLAYMIPVGEGSYTEILLMLREDATKMGHPFLLLGLCQWSLMTLETSMPGYFRFSHQRDYSDYIYSRNDLATLSGKRLQSKRNFCNRFEKTHPDYEYRELTPDLIPLCIKLEEEWMTRKDNLEQDEDYANERRSMRFVFDNWEELGALGGTIFVDNKLVAFTFGGPINSNTFDTCVEKADSNVEGAYAIINRDFARHIPPQFTLINREEDLGIEGLRRAKTSYHPTIILDKYAAMAKHPFKNTNK